MSLSRQQITLLGIFALFIGPVILVIMMRSSWWQYQPAGLKNHGYLVQPPVRLSLEPAPTIDKKWMILYVLDQPCDQECTEDVTALRQIHRAAGRNQEHLAIVLLGKTDIDSALQSSLNSIYPEFKYVTDSAATVSVTLDFVNAGLTDETGDPDAIHTYILDPMSNVVLAYGAEANPNDIHKDLKRLLKWSDRENTQ
jgi:hypothetical protein